jgi:hypothetical protein
MAREAMLLSMTPLYDKQAEVSGHVDKEKSGVLGIQTVDGNVW